MLLRDRNKAQKAKWELFSSTSLVEAVHKARDLGWADKKVQVRADEDNYGNRTYIVEPFEKDCGCPSMLKYADYFIPEDAPIEPDTDG